MPDGMPATATYRETRRIPPYRPGDPIAGLINNDGATCLATGTVTGSEWDQQSRSWRVTAAMPYPDGDRETIYPWVDGNGESDYCHRPGTDVTVLCALGLCSACDGTAVDQHDPAQCGCSCHIVPRPRTKPENPR